MPLALQLPAAKMQDAGIVWADDLSEHTPPSSKSSSNSGSGSSSKAIQRTVSHNQDSWALPKIIMQHFMCRCDAIKWCMN